MTVINHSCGVVEGLANAQRQPLIDLIAKICWIGLWPLLAGLIYAFWGAQEDFLREMWAHPFFQLFVVVGQVLLVVCITAIIWQLVLAKRYRPVPPLSDEECPEITVIVPAYNESELVRVALFSLDQSDYPPEKLNIIAVNDGSLDDTWSQMRQAARLMKNRPKLINCPNNRGKRHALYEGIIQSRGFAIVTVDSDSKVSPQALRHLVSPLVRDGQVGAVAGNVQVLNSKQGFIPRCLDASFAFNFDFIRASQSEVNAVLCTPGALSAYRRDAMLQLLPTWVNQSFCGLPANIGEDRAITNLMLELGLHVVYQRTAVVETQVPTTYTTLCQMLLRWARSDVRETLVMSRFAFRRFRATGATGARIFLLLGWLSIVISPLFWLGALALFALNPPVVLLQLLIGATASSALVVAVYWRLHHNLNGVWAVPYAVYQTLALAWIPLYGLVTPHRNGWLTRQLPPKQTTETTIALFDGETGRFFSTERNQCDACDDPLAR